MLCYIIVIMTGVFVRIAGHERSIGEADPQWIAAHINQRRRDGLDVCVQTIIKTPEANLILTAPACHGVGGGCRPPNLLERKILNLWDALGLNDPKFGVGKVVAFLSRLRNLL